MTIVGCVAITNTGKVIYIFVFTFLSIAIILAVSADHSAVKFGQSVKLFCTVVKADDLQTEIMFLRRTGDKNVTCGTISQYSAKCHAYNTTKYYLSCLHGTNISTSKMKHYGLDIVRMEVVDFTEWLCEAGITKQEQNTVTLTEISK